MNDRRISRRKLCQTAALAALALGPLDAIAANASNPAPAEKADAPQGFRLNYILASALYGKTKLAEILPEVRKIGADSIDIWCLPHSDQREQIDAMGLDAFAALLTEHRVKLGMLTRYPLGPFGLDDEIRTARKLGGKIVLSGSRGSKDPSGDTARKEVREFLEKMKPHVALAQECGITVALENHRSSMLAHPDSLRYFAEFNTSRSLGIAFAPHHLHDWADQIPRLIEELGPNVVFFYAQEYRKGTKEKLPKTDEMLQLPGYGGGLDYKPIVASLQKIDYRGWVEIFMHPFPRGIAILDTSHEITAAVNKSRQYLERCVAELQHET